MLMVNIQARFLPFVGLAVAALLVAIWAGLLRMGWSLPSFPDLSAAHGPLMVSGFLGVLIPLERAVAIRQKWMFAVPASAGLGWMLLLVLPRAGSLLLTLASLGMPLILSVMVRREPHLHTMVMSAGAAAWFFGNVLWLFGVPLFRVVYLWMAFLVLTIAGERLELNRVLRPAFGQLRLFGIFAMALLAASLLCLFDLSWGARLSGLSLLGLSLWFLKNDLATRNIHHTNPLTRYIAICLFAGFLWMGAGGILFLLFGDLYAGPYYDAALHAIFVGFVISMIFGHAPIIFPAILGVPVSYQPTFYLHAILLHVSLLIRLGGDLTNELDIRRWGGLLNGMSILLFLGMTIVALMKGSRAKSM